MILETCSPDPSELAVDHEQLAMVDAAALVPRPGETPTAREDAVSVEREHVVDHDFRAG